MGNFVSRIYHSICGPARKRVIVIGLDAAGKTTILHKLNFKDIIRIIPTLGINIETIHYKNVAFDCWDFGNQEKVSLFHFKNTLNVTI